MTLVQNHTTSPWAICFYISFTTHRIWFGYTFLTTCCIANMISKPFISYNVKKLAIKIDQKTNYFTTYDFLIIYLKPKTP